jgi:hypothetical protein
LPLKDVSSDFQLPLRLYLILVLEGVVQVIAGISAAFLEFALGHDFVQWKCNFLRSLSLLPWVVDSIEGVSFELVASDPQFSLSLHEFTSSALSPEIVLQIGRVALKVALG